MDQIAYNKGVLSQKQVLQLVRAYKQAISSIVQPSEVYLYGSYSKGTATKDSDIDVAVIVPRIENRFYLSGKLWGATRQIDTLIEPVLLEKNESSPLYDDIMRTGMRV